MGYERPTYHPHQEGWEHLGNAEDFEEYVLRADALLNKSGFTSSKLFAGVGEVVVETQSETPVVIEGDDEVVEESDSHWEKKLYLLNDALRVKILPHRSQIAFQARVPDHFQPEQSADTFEGIFRPAVLYQIPATIYRKHESFRSMEYKYKDGTTVFLAKEHNPREYQLRFQAQSTAFSADLINPLEKIDMMDIHARSLKLPYDEYGLTIVYEEDTYDRGKMILELPHTGRTDHLWNPATIQWILGMCVDYPKSPRTPEIAQNVSDRLAPFVLEATGRYIGNNK
jgi:hypothetical protein